MRYRLNRTVTKAECPWLDADLPEGMILYSYEDCTYGCIGPNGKAMTLKPGKEPFFEIPRNALERA